MWFCNFEHSCSLAFMLHLTTIRFLAQAIRPRVKILITLHPLQMLVWVFVTLNKLIWARDSLVTWPHDYWLLSYKSLLETICTTFRKNFLIFSIIIIFFFFITLHLPQKKGSFKSIIAYLTLLLLSSSLRFCITSKLLKNPFKKATGKRFSDQ